MVKTYMKTQTFEPNTLAYIRITGSYKYTHPSAVEELICWSKSQGITDYVFIFIYKDNPK